MSVRKGYASDVQRLLTALAGSAELIEEIFLEREIYIDAESRERLDRVEALRREHLVRVRRDDFGGATVRLTHQLRAVLALTRRHRRLEDVGVDVRDALERAAHLADEWRIQHRAGRLTEADELEDEISEILEDVEDVYDDQLDSLSERISVSYGFDQQASNRARDFRLYINRLEAMSDGAVELLDRIEGEEFEGIAFVERLGTKLRQRFRRHGQRISELTVQLQNYIARARERQRQARRNLRFLQWLRRQPARIKLDAARAADDELTLLHRAPGLALSGHADFENVSLASTWGKIARDALKRHRSLEWANRDVEREPSGNQWNSEGEVERAQAHASAERERHWQSGSWIADYLTEVVRAARNRRESPTVFAADYWMQRRRYAEADEPLPSRRAWVNEVMTLALCNRPIHRKPFFTQFELELDPPLPNGIVRRAVAVDDVGVKVRADVARQRFSREAQP